MSKKGFLKRYSDPESTATSDSESPVFGKRWARSDHSDHEMTTPCATPDTCDTSLKTIPETPNSSKYILTIQISILYLQNIYLPSKNI